MGVSCFLIGLLFLRHAAAQDPFCGALPPSFLGYNVGENHVTVDYKQFKYLEDLGTYNQPYFVFDVHDNGTRVQWRDYDGQVVVVGASSTDLRDGLLINAVNLGALSLWYRVGTVYSRHTTQATELSKINTNLCNFTAEHALVITYDCFHTDKDPNSPKARFQVIVVYGHDNDNNKKTYLLIIYDLLPGHAWDMVWERHQHYITFLRYIDRFPIPAKPNTVVAIDVTSGLALVNGKQSDDCNIP